MVHGDGEVVPFFLWNGVVGDAGGDVGEVWGQLFKKIVRPPPRDGVRPLAFFRVAIVQDSS